MTEPKDAPLTIEPSRFEPLGDAASEARQKAHPLRWVMAATAAWHYRSVIATCSVRATTP